MQIKIKTVSRLPYQAAVSLINTDYPELQQMIIDADEAQLDLLELSRQCQIALSLWQAKPTREPLNRPITALSASLPEVAIYGKVVRVDAADNIVIAVNEKLFIMIWLEQAAEYQCGEWLSLQGELHGRIM